MSNSLAVISSFGFDADHVTEVVLRSGEKLAITGTSRVRVQRPDKLRSDRRGEATDVSLFYDGQTIALAGYRNNLYATAPAPPTLDAAIDFAREQLGLEAPASDLLYSDPYRALMEDVVSATYVGTADIDGAPCYQLAFRGHDVDWQIWIEQGPRSLPRRYLIVSKSQPGAPEFSVTLRSWVVGPAFPDDTFVFRPQLGAERIDFLGMRAAAAAAQTTTKTTKTTTTRTTTGGAR
jgi:hypothetical protein